jgi:endonuclease/exonuclease/phosphatase (EEP) superfamily protein YafD
LLRWCRAIFEADHDVDALGRIISSQADVEDKHGHGDRAIALECDALRYKYAIGDPDSIAVSHNNLANYLTRYGGDRWQMWAHRIAAAVIAYQTGTGLLSGRVDAIAAVLPQDELTPWTFARVCEVVEQVDGVHLAEMLDRLPRRAPDGQAAMAEVLRLAHERKPERHQRLMTQWEPVLSALVAAQAGDAEAAEAAAVLERVLAVQGEKADWRALADVLRRIAAGERDPALAEGLDEVDTAIVGRALDALAGSIQIDPQTWRTLTLTEEERLAEYRQRLMTRWEPVLSALVAAQAGDADAAEAAAVLERVLAVQGEKADWRALADVLRRIAAGERDPALAEGLDEVDTAIVGRALGALTGTIEVDPDAWAAVTAPEAPEQDAGEQLAAFAAAVAGAAAGDADARAGVELVLTEMAADPDWAAVAGRMQRILAGERGPALVEGLGADNTAIVSAVVDLLGEPGAQHDAGPACAADADIEEG